MARVKKHWLRHRQEEARTTWTRFTLPRDQNWPKWSRSELDRFHGPLTNVQGCEKVRLGRKVEHPEEAVFIIRWSSVDALEAFQQSPLCGELLRDLGCADNSPSRILSLRWDRGFNLGHGKKRIWDDLHGRVTLTVLTIEYDGYPQPETWRRAMEDALGGFNPNQAWEDVRRERPPPTREAYLWVEDSEQELESVTDTRRRRAVCYRFFRWNARLATREREEEAAADPEVNALWAKAVASVMPPVETWEQERWDIELPSYGPEFDYSVNF